METGKTLTSETLLVCAGMCTKSSHQKRKMEMEKQGKVQKTNNNNKGRREARGKWRWVWEKKTPKLTKML